MSDEPRIEDLIDLNHPALQAPEVQRQAREVVDRLRAEREAQRARDEASAAREFGPWRPLVEDVVTFLLARYDRWQDAESALDALSGTLRFVADEIDDRCPPGNVGLPSPMVLQRYQQDRVARRLAEYRRQQAEFADDEPT